jgi:WD40 repeat protein
VGSKKPVLELVPEGVGENQKFLIGGADMAEAGNRFVMTEMGRQGRVRLWDFTRDAVRGVAGPAPLGVGVSTAKLSADGNRLLLGRTDGGVHCWNIPNKAEEWRARPRQGHVRSATLSPDGVWWAAGYLDGAIQIGRIAQGKLERVLTLESAFPSALAFTRDGKRLVVLESLRKQSQSVDAGALSWWDTETGTRVGARRTLDFYPHALVLSPEGRYAVVCGQGPRVLSFDMATQQPGPVLHTTGVIQEIAFGHGGDILLTVGTENTAALWHWPSGREVGVRFQAGEREGAFTADGRIVFRSAGVHAVPTIEQVLAPRTIPTRQQSIGAARRATGLRVNAEDRLEALSAAQWQAEVSHTPATH